MDIIKCEALIWCNSWDDWFVELRLANGMTHLIPLGEYNTQKLKQINAVEKKLDNPSNDKTQ